MIHLLRKAVIQIVGIYNSFSMFVFQLFVQSLAIRQFPGPLLHVTFFP